MRADVEKKYKLVGIGPGKHTIAGIGTIDFDTLTLAEADQLYKNKFPYLEKRKKEDEKPK